MFAEWASIESGEQERLFVLLMEYADVFALCNDELGRTNVLQHQIHTGDALSIRQQFRRVCPQKDRKLEICCLRCWRKILSNLPVVLGHHQ